MTAVCIAVLVGVLAAADTRVRERLSVAVSQATLAGAGGWSESAQSLALALTTAARDQSLEHGPLLVFTAVAILLVLCMMRV